jgi:hypothetical protein
LGKILLELFTVWFSFFKKLSKLVQDSTISAIACSKIFSIFPKGFLGLFFLVSSAEIMAEF